MSPLTMPTRRNDECMYAWLVMYDDLGGRAYAFRSSPTVQAHGAVVWKSGQRGVRTQGSERSSPDVPEGAGLS